MIPHFGWRSVLMLGGLAISSDRADADLVAGIRAYMVAVCAPAERIRRVLSRISDNAAAAHPNPYPTQGRATGVAWMLGIGEIAALHLEHRRKASSSQRLADRFVRFASRPRFAGVLVVALILWISGNILELRMSGHAIDPPPFQWLQDGTGILALFLTVLILITQRREYQLDERRAQFTLQLELLAEQKNTKIIGMLEMLMRSHPELGAQADKEVSAMAVPIDTTTILSAIDRTHKETV